MCVNRRVLVVEDEPDVAGLIKHSIERHATEGTSDRIDVEVVHTGHEALRTIADQVPDLIVLDLNLPVVSGFEVCRLLRQRPATSATPVLMLTARGEEHDRVAGLDIGADDYMVKPFGLRELGARVRALLRRRVGTGTAPMGALVYRGEHLVADFDAVSIAVDGEPVRLTRREFDLLRFFVQNKNRVLSRDRLLERVWGYDRVVDTRSVDVHVGRLRGKLREAGQQIETVVGLGYRFVD
jgi:DNA-binding response OmpR family regulator